MLEIDRTAGDDAAAPSAAQAQLARDAARSALQETQRERERLPLLHAEAVSRGDFESARRYKDARSLVEDRAAFAQQQLARAELVLLAAALRDAEGEAAQAARELERAFAQEERARTSYQQATSVRAGAQAQVQAYQGRVEQLRREHAEARRTLDGKE